MSDSPALPRSPLAQLSTGEHAALLSDLEAAGMSARDANNLLDGVIGLAVGADDDQISWARITRQLLEPDHPFAAHQALFTKNYEARTRQHPPPPAWLPDSAQSGATNLSRYLAGRSYEQGYRDSIDQLETFWGDMVQTLGIQFDQPPSRTLDLSDGPTHATWLPGARLNIAASCFDGRDPEQTAVVYQAPRGPICRLSLGELRRRAERVARALLIHGVEPGDAVAVDMPMTVESVEIYLGIVLAGCAVVSIADSFAAAEIATRLRISNARAVFTQDLIVRGAKRLPLYERVVEAQAPRAIVLPAEEHLQVELRDGDVGWSSFIGRAAEHTPPAWRPVSRPAQDTTNILFSSGTTGEPKAIPWDHVTPIKAGADAWIHQDVQPGDVVVWPTNLGWMMGPWLIYAALLNDAAIGLFLGSPLGSAFCRFVEDARVTMLGLVPSLVRTWRTSGSTLDADWTGLRCFSSTGEASSAEDMLWLMGRAGYRPVIEYCGGTEIGGGYITGSLLQPQAPATFSTPAFGTPLLLLGDGGTPAEKGEIALRPPMLGTSFRLLNRDHEAVYFEGMPADPEGRPLRRHGDAMERLPGGYYRAHGRIDDTMNLGGIKVSSAEIERVCSEAAETWVTETAAIAVPPTGGGPDRLVIYAVTTPPGDGDGDGGSDADGGAAARGEAALARRFQSAIRLRLNPLFKVHAVRTVDALPRTASGKVMRRVLRSRFVDEGS